MSDVPPDVPPPSQAPPSDGPLGTVEAIQPLWETFRKGGVAVCPRDGGHMALGVDGLGGAYRFVCVECGLSTPWFEAKFAHLGLALRGTMVPEGGPGGE